MPEESILDICKLSGQPAGALNWYGRRHLLIDMVATYGPSLSGFSVAIATLVTLVWSNQDAQRLYDDLMKANQYNKMCRPVANQSHTAMIHIGLKLAQILAVVRNYEGEIVLKSF